MQVRAPCPGSKFISWHSRLLSCKVSFLGYFPEAKVQGFPNASVVRCWCSRLGVSLTLQPVPLSQHTGGELGSGRCRDNALCRLARGESGSFTPLYSTKGDSHTDGHRLSCCPIKTFIKSHRKYTVVQGDLHAFAAQASTVSLPLWWVSLAACD